MTQVESIVSDPAAALARLTAQSDRTPCAPVRDLLPEGDLAAAYAVQSAIISGRTSEGARLVGRKIGLTNPKVQAQLGVDQPDFGVLLDDMQAAEGETVDWDITIVDTIADNGPSGLFVLGCEHVTLDGLDLVGVQMTLRSGDEVVSRAAARTAWPTR